jgi:hypothetical protein
LLCCDQIFTKEWSEKLSATFLNSRGVKHVEGAKLFLPEEMPDLIDLEARHLWTSRRDLREILLETLPPEEYRRQAIVLGRLI